MVSLHFGGTLSDGLVAQIRERYPRDVAIDALPSLWWCHMHPYAGPDRTGWALVPIFRDEITSDGVFQINDVTIYVSPADQARMRGRTLDFVHEDGVVELATPTI